TDGKGHRTERTDRRRAHDDANDAEEDLCHRVDRIVDLLAQLPETRDGEAREDRNQQHLQELAPGKGADEGGGDDLQKVVDKPLFLGAVDVARDRTCVESGWI